MTAAEKAAADAAFGDNSPEELTADAVQAADAFNRGVIPDPKAAAEPKPGGAVAAEPGSDPEKPETAEVTEKTPEELAAEAEAAKAAAVEKTPEELAAEAEAAGKTPEELEAEKAAAAKPPEKTPEELEAERLAAREVVRPRLRRENFSNETDWKVAQKAASFMAEGMLPSKAEAAAREALGLKPDAAAPTPEVTVSPEVEALQAIEKTIETKRAERKAALKAYDNDKVADLDDELAVLEKDSRKAEKAVEKAETSRASIQSSIERAIKEFPESAVPGHPMYAGVKAFWDGLEANDPLWHDPNRAEVAAQRVAEGLEKLGLKVTRTSKSTSAATPPPVVPPKAPAATPKPQKVSPVPGSARTVTPTVTPDAALDAELKKSLGKNAHVLSTIS